MLSYVMLQNGGLTLNICEITGKYLLLSKIIIAHKDWSRMSLSKCSPLGNKKGHAARHWWGDMVCPESWGFYSSSGLLTLGHNCICFSLQTSLPTCKTAGWDRQELGLCHSWHLKVLCKGHAPMWQVLPCVGRNVVRQPGGRRWEDVYAML